MTKYYDSKGEYVAYCPDEKNLFNDSAEHIGYFVNGFLYDLKGMALGHIKGKVILNRSGQVIYYTKD